MAEHSGIPESVYVRPDSHIEEPRPVRDESGKGCRMLAASLALVLVPLAFLYVLTDTTIVQTVIAWVRQLHTSPPSWTQLFGAGQSYFLLIQLVGVAVLVALVYSAIAHCQYERERAKTIFLRTTVIWMAVSLAVQLGTSEEVGQALTGFDALFYNFVVRILGALCVAFWWGLAVFKSSKGLVTRLQSLLGR